MTNSVPAFWTVVIIALLWPALSLWLAHRISRLLPKCLSGWSLTALILASLLTVEVAYTKIPPSEAVRIMYLTLMDDGTLLGPTNRIASASSAAAVKEVLDLNDAMTMSASNDFEWAREQIPDLEIAVNDPITTAWMVADLEQDESGYNAQARCDMMGAATNADGTMSCYVHFNLSPSIEPVVPFRATIEDGTVIGLPVVSNSFPSLVSVATSDGPSDCYVYVVSVPEVLRNVQLVPLRNIPFGGGDADHPFKVLGGLMPNGRLPRSGEIRVDSNCWWQFEGGVMIGVRTNSP